MAGIGFKPDNTPEKPKLPGQPRTVVQGFAGRNNSETTNDIPKQESSLQMPKVEVKTLDIAALNQEYVQVMSKLNTLTDVSEVEIQHTNGMAELQNLLRRKAELELILGKKD